MNFRIVASVASILFLLNLCVVSAAEPSSQPEKKPAAGSTPAPQKGATGDSQSGADAASTKSNALTDAKKDADSDLGEAEKQIVEKTNAQRAKYGLPPLALDKGLEQTARTHAAWMTNNHTLQHTTKSVGENIAMGQRNTEEAVSAWMASPGHRANILSGSYKRIGVAGYVAHDGTAFWCQQFLP